MAEKNTENNVEIVETEQKEKTGIKKWFVDRMDKIAPITACVVGGLVGALGAFAYTKATAKTVYEPETPVKAVEVPPTETEEVMDS